MTTITGKEPVSIVSFVHSYQSILIRLFISPISPSVSPGLDDQPASSSSSSPSISFYSSSLTMADSSSSSVGFVHIHFLQARQIIRSFRFYSDGFGRH
mmetsp:Transcript_22277/g.46598  ORF Transcript_22277/g.46598 Transcript_22277/m.46598 type:complete len:98 (-) Transcript_22277:1222-1515(-)